MTRHYPTSPLDEPVDERLTFSDVTLLALLIITIAALTVVFGLGALCADHRIAAGLSAIL
jgi:hypothetical protein